MASIFMSYRRADTASTSGRIYDRCIGRFGRHAIFKDVDSIPPGVDFRRYIADVMAKCVALLAIIGPSWLTVTGANSTRRLDEPDDPVRIEIETALAQGLLVLPVLADGAHMPSADALPDSIRALANVNAVRVGFDPDFEPGMRRILALLEEQVTPGSPWQERRDDYDPLPDRQAELLAAVQRNSDAGEPPYQGVVVHSRGELGWILREHAWSGEADAPVDQHADLRGIILRRAQLMGMHLYAVNLQGADLRGADLRGVDLGTADLSAADLRGARMDATTTLAEVTLDRMTKLGDVVWNGVPLAQVPWYNLPTLGDERFIKAALTRGERSQAMENAARAYAGLARALRAQGLYEPAWRYRMSQLKWDQRIRLRQLRYGDWMANAAAYVVVGSQERPIRMVTMWLLVIFIFAGAYYGLGQHATQDYLQGLNFSISSTGTGPKIDGVEAVVLSLRAATGQIAPPTELGVPAGDVFAFQVVGTIEAWCSLLIIGLLVTTWWRRTMRD